MIEKTIILGDQPIAYTLRQSRRAQRLRLVVHADGSVTLTSPVGASEGSAERFLRQKAAWVLSKIQLFGKFQNNPAFQQLAAHRGRRDYLKYKEEARALVLRRIAQLNGAGSSGTGYGFAYGAISIKNQKTCWGSCSRRGNLNFNYKILFLPPALQDYILVHELCHLRELNHSPRFWALVARAVPDYAALRKQLRRSAADFPGVR